MNTTINYTIEFKNGKNIKESDYNWFIGNLNQPNTIKSISIDLYVSFYDSDLNRKMPKNINPAAKLCELALINESTDNISVVIQFFD